MCEVVPCQVPIARPYLGPEERAAALAVLESGELTKGPRVETFEQAFAAFHGARHAVATSSGTSALTAALLAHGIGRGDEVVVPSFSFFATASAVVSVGATPVFADIEADTYCLSAAAAAAALTPRTRAILPVHLYGLPVDLPAFEALCARHGLALIEDAAQAHGAKLGERSVGGSGTAAFSFFATKNMTTMEGGMVLTSDNAVAEKLRMLRNHGRAGDGTHAVIGGNFRMTELAAAIGNVQLARLRAWTDERVSHAHHYDAHLKHAVLPVVPPGREHVFHQYTVRLPGKGERERVLARLNARGVGARVYYTRPIHTEPAFAGRLGSLPALPETERACSEVLSLPVYPSLTESERAFVVEAFNAAVER